MKRTLIAAAFIAVTALGVGGSTVSADEPTLNTAFYYHGGWFDVVADEGSFFVPYQENELVVYDVNGVPTLGTREGLEAPSHWRFAFAESNDIVVLVPAGPPYYEVLIRYDAIVACGIGSTRVIDEQGVRFHYPPQHCGGAPGV